ncbi:hypothetical protein B7494_g3219 [Chlorociboria aeruginascens]|nr:hypothetical protein B7494_g3219 [Chlorociboria aeruginascens]
MKVVLLPHDPSWAMQFDEQRAALVSLLTNASAQYNMIVHVGSTSIAGIPAKPVLDIDIIIPLSSLPSARKALSDAGYADLGEMNIPGRFVFRQPGYGKADAAFGHDEGEMRRNTYLMIEGSLALRNHLDLKRVLESDVEMREEYAAVKRKLAEREFANIGEYATGKNEIMMKILRRAGWNENDLNEVRQANT